MTQSNDYVNARLQAHGPRTDRMTISPFPSPWCAKFADLPTVQIISAQMSDDDVQAHSDFSYWRALLNDIVDRVICDGYLPTPWPITFSDDIDVILGQLAAIRRHPDHPGELLARWRDSVNSAIPQPPEPPH